MDTLKKINVMHLIATNFYGGPEKQIVTHLKRLNNNIFKPVLASYVEKDINNEILEKAANEDIHACPIPMANAIDFRALLKLEHLVKTESIDLLCAHGYKSIIMGWYVAKKLNIPFLVFSRGYTSEDIKVSFYEWLERKVLHKVTGIIYVSEGQKNKLHSLGVYGQNEWVVHNAIEIPEYEEKKVKIIKKNIYKELSIPENNKLVVTAGRLSPEKGHHYLIDAISKTNHELENITFVICGDGVNRRRLQDQAKKLHVDNKCMFVGFRRDMDKIYQAMDLFILPSLTEGLPNVILESFSYMKPVIATKVGGVPELVHNNKNGILIDAANTDQLADAIINCLKSDERMKALGEAGLRTVQENFTFAKQTMALEQIYKQVLH